MDTDESRWLQVVTLHERTNHTEQHEEISDNAFAIDNGMHDDVNSSLEHDKDLEYDFINALQSDEYDSENYEDDYYYDNYHNETYDNIMANDMRAKTKHYQDLLKSINELEKQLHSKDISNGLNAESLAENLGPPNIFDYGINETDIFQNDSFSSGLNFDSGDDYYYDDESLLNFDYNDTLFQDILNDKNLAPQDVVVPPVQHIRDSNTSSEYLPELDFDSLEPSIDALLNFEYDDDKNIELDDVVVPPVGDVKENNYLSDYYDPEYDFETSKPSSTSRLHDYDFDFDDLVSDVFDVDDEDYLQDMPNYDETNTVSTSTLSMSSHSSETASNGIDKAVSDTINPSTRPAVAVPNTNEVVIPKLSDLSRKREVETTSHPEESPRQAHENLDYLFGVQTELIYPGEYSDGDDVEYESSNDYGTVD